jgi:hypothetical protein
MIREPRTPAAFRVRVPTAEGCSLADIGFKFWPVGVGKVAYHTILAPPAGLRTD